MQRAQIYKLKNLKINNFQTASIFDFMIKISFFSYKTLDGYISSS